MKTQNTHSADEREFELAYTPHEHEELRALALRGKPDQPAAPIVTATRGTVTLPNRI